MFVFDSAFPWFDWETKDQIQAVRKLCQERGATYVELRPRAWGGTEAYKWLCRDETHMVTAGHVFLAKELLKDWAKTAMYGGPATK